MDEPCAPPAAPEGLENVKVGEPQVSDFLASLSPNEVSLDQQFFDIRDQETTETEDGITEDDSTVSGQDTTEENFENAAILKTFSVEQLQFLTRLNFNSDQCKQLFLKELEQREGQVKKKKRRAAKKLRKSSSEGVLRSETRTKSGWKPYSGRRKKSTKSGRVKKGEEDARVYKPGPRDIGRNRDWKPAIYDIKQDNNDFLKPRLEQPKKKKEMNVTKGKFQVYKEGPRDIGRIKDWKPAEYDIKVDQGDFLKEKTTKIKKDPTLASGTKRGKFQVYKPGPRDIGRNTSWKRAKYDVKDSGKLFAPRLEKARKSKSPERQESKGKFQVYKEGPRDIGWIKGWKPAQYDLKKESGSFLKERLNTKSNKKSASQDVEKEDSSSGRGKFQVYKEGPRDIGRIKGWKPVKYDIKEDTENFLAPKVSKPKKLKLDRKKAGPREIGRVSSTASWKSDCQSAIRQQQKKQENGR